MCFYIDEYRKEQNEVLEHWKCNKNFFDALGLVDNIFLGNQSFTIYEKFSNRNDIANISKLGNYKNDILKFFKDYFDENEAIYLLFAGNYPEKYRFGLSEQSYPIFKIEFRNIFPWINLIEDDSFQTIIISDLVFNKVIEISNIIDCNQSFKTYTVSAKLKHVKLD